MIVTKNLQSRDAIEKMVGAAFPGRKASKVTELTDGFCNVAYDICLDDGSETILKISSKDKSGNTSNEINLMAAEVSAMKIVAEKTDVKVPKVYFHDDTRTLCDGEYFFMEKIKGDNLHKIEGSLPEEILNQLQVEIGRESKKLSEIKNPDFGMLGDEKRFSSLYEYVRYLLCNLLSDAEKKNVDVKYSQEDFLSQLEKDRIAFDEVKSASLVHWDLWIGNVFVKENRVSGIIDWERAMWGEPFMDDRFRCHTRNQWFLQGFGKSDFTEAEKKRIRWYDIILYLTMMIEVFYRGFENKDQYFWAKEMLGKVY